MRVLVFGSSALTAKHLATIREYLRDVLEEVDQGAPLVLVHMDRAPGKAAGAVGAAKLSEVAAQDVWPAAQRRLYRTQEVLRYKPDRAFCFHTSPELGEHSGALAAVLKSMGVPLVTVIMDGAGTVLSSEAWGPALP